jgi:Cu-Zn family superoxide dismutase
MIRSGRTVRVGRALATVALAAALAGCQSTPQEPGTRALIPKGDALEAVLMPIGGSAANGTAFFGETGDGIAIRVHALNLPEGLYRVVIHTTGNCTSPNGFSAGPPLVLPGASEHLMAHMPPAYAGPDSVLTVVVRLAGVQLRGPNGIEGRSVVLHYGAQGSLLAQPDVPNDRVACGVVGPARSLIQF